MSTNPGDRVLPIVSEQATSAHLAALCEAGASEGARLDFKRCAPGKSDRDKHEFLKDVCALANADGGDLLFGVDEEKGKAAAIEPIGDDESPDALRLRLGQTLDSGLEPRVRGIQFHPVSVQGGFVLIVRVPASFDGPHRYIANGHSKFVSRNGVHTSEMTYMQLRSAFDRTTTLTESARTFIERRIAAISDRKTWRPVVPGPIAVVHMVPLSGLAGRAGIDVATLAQDYRRLLFRDWGGGTSFLNLDGLVVHPGRLQDGEGVQEYALAFRNGAVEAVKSLAWTYDGRNIIHPPTATFYLREAIANLKATVEAAGIAGPAILQACLLDVTGYEFVVDNAHWRRSPAFADRPNMVFPETWIESVQDVEIDAVARPIADLLWQAFGFAKCKHYGPDGSWIEPR